MVEDYLAYLGELELCPICRSPFVVDVLLVAKRRGGPVTSENTVRLCPGHGAAVRFLGRALDRDPLLFESMEGVRVRQEGPRDLVRLLANPLVRRAYWIMTEDAGAWAWYFSEVAERRAALLAGMTAKSPSS
jgi:hypothetical protein